MNYASIRDNTVLTGIKSSGVVLSITRLAGGTYDPITGVTTGDTSTTYTGYALELSYKLSDMTGTNVQNGDLKYMITSPVNAGEYIEPAPSEQITIGGVLMSVVYTARIKPGDTVLYYEVYCRE